MNPERMRRDLESMRAFKAWEIEDGLDRRFFRPLAAMCVAGCARLRATPNQVSVAGMLVRMSAAPLLMARFPVALLLAVALLWLAEVLDATDGQLARRLGQASLSGRIVDGLCDKLAFLVVYIALGLGLASRYGEWVWIPASLLAGVSHSHQGALYDFYRTEYIRIVKDRVAAGRELLVVTASGRATRPGGIGGRAMMGLYQAYLVSQTVTTPAYQPLKRAIETTFRDRDISPRFAEAYAAHQLGMVRSANRLGPNVHLVLLSLCVLLRRPEWYLLANLVPLNLYAIALTWAQRGPSARLLEELAHEPHPEQLIPAHL